MRAMLPTALASLPTQLRGLLDVHRANLRSRTYQNAALNPPTVPHDVIPVTTPDGVKLRVHAYGPADGNVIVLVHGWTCAIEYWYPQINAFAGEYRVIAYDQRGHGESELGSSPLDCDLLADDLCAVLDTALRPGQRAVLVGHSLGGMTLQAWAGKHPDRVRAQAEAVLLSNTGPHSLIAETTVVPPFNKPLSWLGGRIIPLPFWFGRLGLGTPIVFPPIAPVRWAFARQIMTLDAPRELVDFSMAVVRSCPASVRAKFGFLLADMHLGESARNLVVPTTLLAGAFDDMTPPVHSEQLAEILAEVGSLVRYEVLPTGHLGNVEAYERFNEELGRVLDSVYQPVEAVG
ncbi:alpha/beta fold hydrolase [Nocardia cyriacigeorgica]|uniref:alpha/beta fold hydrolase n=1 Tax=Nocardia cyriacigeorgica TaxID=135487 RepID=UPI0013D586D1|nr:alpha/beta hydrolase [Nocardia cyriacigeorgica]MBF6437285.1 alpha/beta hydrolase [Nocardia cyriacigeorgica]NEW25689.1 alpha/beta hydrolase [Nocardia cyriacigeorgica]